MKDKSVSRVSECRHIYDHKVCIKCGHTMPGYENMVLKDCPFCGGEAFLIYGMTREIAWVECEKCRIATRMHKSHKVNGVFKSAEELSAEEWNRRAYEDCEL